MTPEMAKELLETVADQFLIDVDQSAQIGCQIHWHEKHRLLIIDMFKTDSKGKRSGCQSAYPLEQINQCLHPSEFARAAVAMVYNHVVVGPLL